MKNKSMNYVLYGLIFLVIVFALLLLFNVFKKNSVDEIILNTPNIQIETQETKKIEAYVANDKDALLEYVSTNSNIIEVDNEGNVTGISDGKASVLIKYTTKDGTQLLEKCSVLVQDKVKIESISLPKGNLLMSVGSSFQIEPTIEPIEFNKRLNYISSNEDIVTVSKEGVVTAIDSGNAVISISHNDKNIDMLVYVTDNDIEPHMSIMPTNIEIDDKLILTVGDEKKLNYTVTPNDANKDDIMFISLNEDIIKTEKDTIKALKYGNATLNIKTYDNISLNVSVTVYPKINEFKITSNENLFINVNETSTITYNLDPPNVEGAEVTFKSNNPKVASVSTDGKVQGLSIGDAVISISCGNITRKVNVRVHGYQRIHFIKQTVSGLGQEYEAGDAILLESSGHFAMIDTGFETKKDNEFVYKYLTNAGVKKLDFILLTHAHDDHYGGANYIMNRMTIDRLYLKSNKGYKDIINLANSKKIPITYIKGKYTDGQGFTFSDMSIKLYNIEEDGDKINLNSLLQLITVNNYKVFLAADMPKAGSGFLKNVSKTIGKINVLKMPHHGYYECGMSTSAANNFKPDYVIVTNTFTKGRTGCYETLPSNTPIYYNKDTSRNSIIVDLSKNKINIIK